MDKQSYPQTLEIYDWLQMKHQSIYNRLRKIEGQIRGIEDMIAKDRSDTDVLIQLEAAKSSLSSALSSLIEEMVSKNDSGKVELSETQVRAILRSIKKS